MKNNISELTPIKSPGVNEITVKKECEKHGTYDCKIRDFRGIKHESMCPECENILILKREKQEEDERLKERNRVISDNLKESGIPLRFINKDLIHLESKNAKQKRIYDIINKYPDALKDGSIASLILCGKPGTGKTHIGCSLVKQVILSGKIARIITTSILMRKVKSTYNKDSELTEDDIYGFYGSLDLLVIDEVGVQFGSDTEKLIFYEIINQRYNNLMPTVLISNLTSEELKGFIGERAFDRFKEDGGAILAFDWESYRK